MRYLLFFSSILFLHTPQLYAHGKMTVHELIASLAFVKHEIFRSQLSQEQKAEKIADVMHELIIMQEYSCKKSVAVLVKKISEVREISEEIDYIDQAIDRVPDSFWSLIHIGQLNFFYAQEDFSNTNHSRFVNRLAKSILERISEEDIDETYKNINCLLRSLRLRRSYTYPR